MDYIKINNKKIELTKEQVEEIKKSFGLIDIELSEIPVGDTFKIGEHEFIVLEHSKDTTAVILKDLLIEEQVFSNTNNNYKNSYIDNKCNEFGSKIADIIGADSLIEHTVDLTSDDGLKDYGTIKRKMSLLTTELYRRYVLELDKHKIDKWWWLATPHSTQTHENANWIKCVSPSGGICDGNYDGDCGVRPFCILKSNIFVSK